MSDKKITVTTAPKNRIVVTKGGGYSTIDTLVELRDVSAANVINDDVLVYVAANGNFVFKEVPFVNAAFTKANAANVLAYTVGINANAYTNAVGFSGNSYSILVGASSNAWANSVGIGGNNYSNAVGIVGNNFTISVGTAGNNFALYLGYSSNSWANTIGISGNNYSNTIGVAGNNYTNAVGAAGNNYTNLVGASANAWANALVFSANSNAGFMANAANARANSVGVAGNNYTNAVGIAGNNYTNAVGLSGNNYTNAVGVAGNNYTNAVGVAGNNYTNAVGVAGNNYTVFVGASSNAWANSVNVYSDATYFKKSGGTVSGSVSIVGNFGITGNLSVTGNTYFISTDNYRVSDPLIYLAGNNYTSDIVDIGFIANYVNTTGANVHTGLYREHENKEWYLFQGYDKEPDNNHIGALSNNMTLAILNADLRTSNLILGGTNAISWISSAFSKANNALANTSGVSFAGNLFFPAGNVSIGYSTNPGYQLFVNGQSYFQSGIVTGQGLSQTATGLMTLSAGGPARILLDGGNYSRIEYLVGGSTKFYGGTTSASGPFIISTDGGYGGLNISQTNNVGIGTDTPGGALHIAKALTRQILLNRTEIGTTVTDGAYIGIGGVVSDGLGIINQEAGPIKFGTSDTERMRITSTGDVGIGTSAPSSTLHVIGTANITSSVTASDYNSSTTGYKISGTQVLYYSGGVTYLNDLGGGIGLRTASTTRLFIDTSGNVGIGTSSPSSKLQVNGTVTIANTGLVESFRSGANTINLNMYNEANGTLSWEGSAGQLFSITNDLSGSLFTVNDVSGIPSIEVDALGNVDLAPFGGNVGIGTSNPVFKLDVNGDARITGNLTLGDATTDTITVNAANFNLANNISFDSGTLFIDKNNDRVGIGTTSPAYTLDVNGTIESYGSLSTLYSPTGSISPFATPTALRGLRLQNTDNTANTAVGIDFVAGSSSTATSYIVGIREGNFLGALAFGTRTNVSGDYAEAMRITSAGRVGIGTTSPAAKLDITGGTSTSNTTSLLNLTQTWNSSGNTFTAIQTNITDTASASASKLIDLQVAGNTKFKVEKSGDIYIAHSRKIESYPDTYNNYTSIDFGAQGSASMAFYQNGTPATAFRWNDAVPGVRLRSSNSLNWSSTDNAVQTADLAIWRDGSNILAQRFGTSAQTFRLYGTYTDSSNYERLTFFANSTAAYIQTQNGGTGTARPLYLGANNLVAMSIDASGNVGIGTAAPTAIFHVNAGANGALLSATGPTGGTAYPLDVYGNLSAAALVRVRFGTAANFFANNSYIETQTLTATTSDMRFGTSGNERMRVTGAGNVGIGTTSPAYKLDVAGTINALSTAGDANGLKVTATAGYDSWINLYRQGYVNWYLGTFNNSTRLDIRNDSLTAMSIAGSTGHVGINTISPKALLDVKPLSTSNTFSMVLSSGQNVDGFASLKYVAGYAHNDLLLGNFQDASGYSQTAISFGYTSDPARKLHIGSANNSTFDNSSSFVPAVTVTSGGRVGIGTTTPTDKLTVSSGHLRIDSGYCFGHTPSTQTFSYDSKTMGSYSIGWFSDSWNSQGSTAWIAGYGGIKLFTGNALAVAISNTASVGIGTTSPFARMHVAGSITGGIGGNAPDTSGNTAFGGLRVGGGPSYDISLDFGVQGNQNPVYSWIQSRTQSNYALNLSLVLNPNGGNVGIGTSTPGEKLQVAGNIYSTGYVYSDSYTSFTEYRIRNSENNKLTWSTGLLTLQANTNTDILFSPGLSERMRITSGGSVGIGIITPSARLHIAKAGTSDEFIIGDLASNYVKMGGIGSGISYIRSFESAFDINNPFTNGVLLFSTAGSERLRITSTGNVGIGTTSPIGRLDVWSVGSGRGIQTNPSDGGYALSTFNSSAGNAEQFNIKHNLSAVELRNERGQLNLVTNTANPIVFYTANIAERMRINLNGNVGIANSAPDALLHVAGTTILGGDTVGTMDVKFSRLLGGTRVINHWFSHSANSPWYLFGQNMTWNGERTGTVDPTHAYRPYYEAYAPIVGYKEFGFADVTSGSIASSNLIANLVLTNTGRVGIGTTTPSARLHANTSPGTIAQFTGGPDSGVIFGAGGLIGFTDPAGTNGFIFNSASNYAYTQTNGLERMRVTGAGNVGIGTATPGATLDIKNDTLSAKILQLTGNSTYLHYFSTETNSVGTNGNRLKLQTQSAQGEFIYATNVGTRFIIDANGNIGVGTTTPTPVGSSATLSINSATAGASGILVHQYNGAQIARSGVLSGYYTVQDLGSTNGLMIDEQSALPVIFRTNATERMRIDSSGNVGIGTAAPQTLLDVAGSDNNGIQYRTATRWISIGSSGGLSTVASGSGTEMVFSVGSERMRIDANGNIGIGTTAPAEKLHVANGSILLDRTYYLKSRDDLGTVRQLIGTSADGTVNVRGFRGTSMMDGVNGSTYLYDSGGVGTQRLSVTATGVGIGGILAGAERLEVNGNVKANSYIMANSAIAPITVVTTTTANQIIDSFANTTWRSAQYNITMTSNTDYHTTQISLIHDGANAYITEYGTLSTANDLGSFSATVTSGTVRLNVVPTFANTTINMLRTTNK